jgi:hypothetical protein
MNNIFSPINKSLITTGFLKEYSLEFNNWDNYDGVTLHDSKIHWRENI